MQWGEPIFVQKSVNARKFQYRKRYGLHAICEAEYVWYEVVPVSIPQAVWIACNHLVRDYLVRNGGFQYRKRYGLHAIGPMGSQSVRPRGGFNTASGMDCMQYVRNDQACHSSEIGFNTASGMDCMQFDQVRLREVELGSFQYRKRYGLHAILENTKPEDVDFDVSIPQAVWIACNEKGV